MRVRETGEEGNSVWLKELSHGKYDKNKMKRENKKKTRAGIKKIRACQKFTVTEQRSDPSDCGADQLGRLKWKI